MTNYINLLLEAINMYDENNEESKNRLRDLVCIISENDKLKQDPLIRELLYSASNKMRVFGYNVQNGFYHKNVEMEQNDSELTALRNQVICNNYRSKVRENNLLDKSQKDLIDFFESLEIKRMLVSAPTSYGKTFIMREILYINRRRYNNVLLVFPTVALLRENAVEMEKLNKEKDLGYHVIKSIDNEINQDERNIFVFTPERAMQLLANYPDLKLDFFFYDEMYKIDEDYNREETDDEQDRKDNNIYHKKNFLDEGRAKTFRICLYFLSKNVPEYYLAGPNLKKDNFGPGMKKYLALNKIQIQEIHFEPTKRIPVYAYNTRIDEQYDGLEYLEKPAIEKVNNKVKERICEVIKYIEEHQYGATMLYCTTPAKATQYANILHQSQKKFLLPNENREFEIFLKHIKNNYDIEGSISKWSFVQILEHRFGMHHGKMPKYIQKEILKLFNNGTLELLFCTSTIVEGVNTNARNMVVLNSTKGVKPLTVFDFKNIVGRAGRYYHNFVGRYFLFDKRLLEIEKASESQLNFITYDTPILSEIDIDNAYYEDLTNNNKVYKDKREQEQKEYLLTEKVFNKNRLIRKEDQEALLQVLVNEDRLFYKFYDYTTYPDILEEFTKFHAMSTILDCCQMANLLDENTVKRYKGINNTYTSEGFKGLLKYEISVAEIKEKSIDSAYMAAFKTQKEIIEHKFPKLLALFESIFIRAMEMRFYNPDNINFSLSRVSRYYETGVKSYFGEQLIEFGFPVDAIKKIELYHPKLITLNANDTEEYINKNLPNIKKYLDEYEHVLIDEALKTLF